MCDLFCLRIPKTWRHNAFHIEGAQQMFNDLNEARMDIHLKEWKGMSIIILQIIKFRYIVSVKGHMPSCLKDTKLYMRYSIHNNISKYHMTSTKLNAYMKGKNGEVSFSQGRLVSRKPLGEKVTTELDPELNSRLSPLGRENCMSKKTEKICFKTRRITS